MSQTARSMPRDYRSVLRALMVRLDGVEPGSEQAMRAVVASLWEAFGRGDGSPHADGSPSFSWVGFYQKDEGESMSLVCREPKPACSPIGLHGMCGRGWKERGAFVVRDVATLGDGYVACDPKDRSELVVPVVLPGTGDGECWGVLDADSYQVGGFDGHDAEHCVHLLQAAGLMPKGASPVPTWTI